VSHISFEVFNNKLANFYSIHNSLSYITKCYDFLNKTEVHITVFIVMYCALNKLPQGFQILT